MSELADAGPADDPRREILGWYTHKTDEPLRVRVQIEAPSLALYTLSDRLVARWSLNRLENGDANVPVGCWALCDPKVPDSWLMLENDRDYGAVQHWAKRLASRHSQSWRQLGLAAIESGNLTGWPVVVAILVGSFAVYLWRSGIVGYCIATQVPGLSLLNCVISRIFMTQ